MQVCLPKLSTVASSRPKRKKDLNFSSPKPPNPQPQPPFSQHSEKPPFLEMAPLTTASRLCLRSAAGAARPSQLAAARAFSTSAVRRDSASGGASYTSPFRIAGAGKGNQIPDFGNYMSKEGEGRNKLISYFMVGSMGALTAAGAKSTVEGRWPIVVPLSSNWSFDITIWILMGIFDNADALDRILGQHVRVCRCLGHGQG